MNNFDIRMDQTAKCWVVTLKRDFSTGSRSYLKGDVAFVYSYSGDKHTDFLYIITQLVNEIVVHEDNRFGNLDNALGMIPSDKFLPITVFTTSPTMSPLIANMFSQTIINEEIRLYAVDASLQVSPNLKRYVEGAYVSTIPTLENIITLRNKMGQGSARLQIDNNILFCGLGLVLGQLKPHKNLMHVSMREDIGWFFGYNPVAGNGYKHYNIKLPGNKNCATPFAREDLKRILTEIKDYIGRSEELIPPQVHVFTAKPEVRDVDAEMGKIRLIGMVGQLHDMICKILSMPFISAWRRAKCNMIGCSVWSSLTHWLLWALDIEEYNHLPEQIRRGTQADEEEEKKYCFITFDIKGQDVSYKTAQLLILNLIRLLWCRLDDRSVFDDFMELFAFETANSTIKLVQWFGDQWYLVLALMCSGSLLTADFNTLFSYIMSVSALIKLLLPYKIHPMDIIKKVKFAFYGDDWIWKIPFDWTQMFGPDVNDFPLWLAQVFQDWGITLKRGETKMYKSNKMSGRPFFTHIVNDEIKIEGVHFLQRYFVKYDINMKPLHPNSKTYAWILPWRKTEAYATRIATDAWNFKGKPGRSDKRDLNPLLAAYVKAFGLLMDAGPNKKAHRFIKCFMLRLAQQHPDIPALSYDVCRGPLSDLFHKLDRDRLEKCLPAITEICYWDDNMSYNYVVSRMGVSHDFLDPKSPLYIPANVRTTGVKDKRVPYVKDGTVIFK